MPEILKKIKLKKELRLLYINAMFSMVELSTAMPRAGGVYYTLDRSLVPFFGTIGEVGTYLYKF